MGKFTKLTKGDIIDISDLIKIFIPDDELDEYSDQLETALEFSEVFDELRLDEVGATSGSIGVINVYRNDKVEPGLTQEQAISGASNKKDGFIVVQRVVKK